MRFYCNKLLVAFLSYAVFLFRFVFDIVGLGSSD